MRTGFPRRARRLEACRGGSAGLLAVSGLCPHPSLLQGSTRTSSPVLVAAGPQAWSSQTCWLDRQQHKQLPTDSWTAACHEPSRQEQPGRRGQLRGHLCEGLVKHRPEGQAQWRRFGTPRGGGSKRAEGATSQTGSHVSSVGVGPARRPGQERIGERDVKGAGAGLVAAVACAVLPGTLHFLRGGTKGFLFSVTSDEC